MTTDMTDDEARIEREIVECVFCLGGGELDTEASVLTDDNGKEWTFYYVYDGSPSYAARDWNAGDTFTVVRDCLWGLPPERLTDARGNLYARVAGYRSSGESECPLSGCESDDATEGACPYCDAAEDEEHGCVYLGEGWCEVVYQCIAEVLPNAPDVEGHAYLKTLSDADAEYGAACEREGDGLDD